MSIIFRFLLVLACALWVAPAWAQDDDSTPAETESEAAAQDEAEEEGEASEEEERTEEAATEEEDVPAPTPGKAPLTEEVPDDEIIDDEEEGDEEVAAEDEAVTPGSEPADGEAPAEGNLDERSQEETATQSAAALGAGSAMVSQDEAAKPWTLSASASVNLGSSVLSTRVEDSLVTFTGSAFGLYKIANLFEGRVDAYGAFSFNQTLDPSNTGGPQGGVNERPFIFNDVIVGALGRSLFVEDNTGLIFGYNTLFRLPTSPLAGIQDRVLRWDNSVNMTKAFSNAGPGTVVLSLSETFRYDFSPENPSFDEDEFASLVENACRSENLRADGTCASSISNLDYGFITTLSARYLLNFGLNVNVRASLFYSAFHRLDRSTCTNPDLEAGIPCDEVINSNSPNANDLRPANAIWFTSVSLGYVITPNLATSLGFSTIAPLIQQSGNNSRAPGNPFFNFAETNATNFFLSLTGTY